MSEEFSDPVSEHKYYIIYTYAIFVITFLISREPENENNLAGRTVYHKRFNNNIAIN